MSGRGNAAKLTRCPCCGSWGYTCVWDFRRYIYCEHCEEQGHEPGRSQRNSCRFCQRVAPENVHWQDKPVAFCLTMDWDQIQELVSAHKRGCRFCDIPNRETPLTKRYDSTLGKVYVCDQHTSHTMSWEEYKKSRTKAPKTKRTKPQPSEQQQTLF